MPKERRFFKRLPQYLQTDGNNRSSYIAEDVLFEPENAGFLSGYIGDVTKLSTEDLQRLPQIAEGTAERQKYQLSIGSVLVNPDTNERTGGAFYTDLVGQISSNGGLTNDPNRLFETPYYTYSPPIDYDKHINFSRYYWTGQGTADINGEYITKEIQGSQTTFYKAVGGSFVPVYAILSDTAPLAPTQGTLWENTSAIDRIVTEWDGSVWVQINYNSADNIPASTNGYTTGIYVYVTRSGQTFNRPLLWKFSTGTGRWVAQAVVVGPMPTTPSPSMVWEDATNVKKRVFKIYTNGAWVNLVWKSQAGPNTIGVDGEYIYDTRLLSNIVDGWSSNNWWRHYDDLSPIDRAALGNGDQAIRPIIEFWAGIDIATNNNRTKRNDTPRFKTYTYDITSDQVVGTTNNTTLYQYKVGTGIDDLILGFPVTFTSSGEFTFELTLETDTITSATGYRYFIDTFTGYAHSVWAKSSKKTSQIVDANGLGDVPVTITSNADHTVTTVMSRSTLLNHMSSVIKTQTNFIGNEFGLNNFRWTNKDVTIGATMIDCENSLLRVMGTLQDSKLSIPNVIRKMASEYKRVLTKFDKRLTQMWDTLVISNPNNALIVTASEAVDVILTALLIGKTNEFPYHYSDMGTYTETQISNGIVGVLSTGTQPIYIPPSPARIGATPVYKPEKFTDIDGITRLRGHDGIIIKSFGDDRDLVWLELQNRFYNATPLYYRSETTTFSTRRSPSNFHLQDYYGNTIPQNSTAVDLVVSDYNNVITPIAGTTVLDTGRAVLAYYDGAKFVTTNILVDDIFHNATDGEYYIFNGFGVFLIDRHNNAFKFDYTTNEYSQIMRREFERWAVSLKLDFVSNLNYSSSDPFTWNYRSAGVEGHYMGIYTRLYRTIRPHSHPWEIVGYSKEPDWWRISYVPTSVASDNTPRYSNTHNMWVLLGGGIYDPAQPADIKFAMTAPIPVDALGNLIDPIAAGVVNEAKLVETRKNDSWIYSDGAPVEQDFISSTNFVFASALMGYLMKPGIFAESLWSELYVDIGRSGTHKIWNFPHVVHNATLTRPPIATLPVHLEVVNGTTTRRIGINAWISEYTHALGGDITKDFGDIIRNTQVSLGWKAAGYINHNRSIIKTLGGLQIPFEDVHTILHRSTPTHEFFGSGILITREGTGYRVFGFDLFDPYFTIDVAVQPIVGGQVELREDIIATAGQHAFTVTQFKLPQNNMTNDSAKLAILINGKKIKQQHITITSATTFSIEQYATITAGDIITPVVLTSISNPSTTTKQFQVDGVMFPYIDSGQGRSERIEYGRYYDTSTEVINFMLGYGRQLVSDGWVFDDTVAIGVVQDWLHGAKAFASWVLKNANTSGAEFFYTPFTKSAKFTSTFGQVLNVEAVQNGAYGIIDKNADPIDPDAIFTSRIDNQITLTPNNSSNEIFGARILVAIDQHATFFSNVTKFNDTIYDPVTALFQTTLRVDAYRTNNWNGRLEADGFVISNGVLLPNFEKQTKDIIKFYDRVDGLDDPMKRDLARELYGWYPNDEYIGSDYGNKVLPSLRGKIPMMSAIGADDRSQFDYHRGMIHTKGTMRPLIAFSRGTRIGTNNVLINEDWAWQWCEYGDTRHEVVKFSVNKHDFTDKLQVIEFNTPTNLLDNILQIPTFNRSTPDVGAWIIPPISGQPTSSPYVLPTTITGVYKIDNNKVSVNILDTIDGTTKARQFHFDPIMGPSLNDGVALSEIDYIGHIDPARYTSGTGASYADGNTWGIKQVGQYWWDRNRAKYVDYKTVSTDYNQIASDWGKLKYFKASVSRTNDLVTVITNDIHTGVATAHGLVTGDKVDISHSDQVEYNTAITVTVTNSTTFTYTIASLPATPATGNIIVTVGFIDIVTWVMSPVPPSGWDNYVAGIRSPNAPSGTVYNNNDSYVAEIITSSAGIATTYYYFWVIDNTSVSNIKIMSAVTTSLRISNPTGNITPWFGIIDTNHMISFTGGAAVQDNYAIEITQDQRTLANHMEWLLITEGDALTNVPKNISDKIVDSLAGQDVNGNTVPSIKLSITEKYGTSTFPQQTIFKNRVTALKTFVDAANAILHRKNLNTVSGITTIFPISAENTYWKRDNYIDVINETKVIFDTVISIAVRDARNTDRRYTTGDLIKVNTTTNIDLWTQLPTPSVYSVDATRAFTEVGIDNHSISIILDATSSAATIRSVFTKVYGLLSKAERNSLIFSMLYEMMEQNTNADWFIKTSYISTHTTSTMDKSGFVRPNENEAILANVLDSKPYRTKIRTSAFTYNVNTIEAVNIGLGEIVDQKVTLVFDRLNCFLEDEAGWNSHAWDNNSMGWDNPVWDWSNQGLTEWVSLGIQMGSPSTNTYVFNTPSDATLYDYQVIVKESGNVIDLNNIQLTYTLTKSHTTINITFSSSLGASYTVEVSQSKSFYIGNTPILGITETAGGFTPYASTFKHHVARLISAGLNAPFAGMENCANGGSAEERITNTIEDSLVIRVTNSYSTLYQSWDATPWDVVPFDKNVNNIGDRVFFLTIGNEVVIPAGPQSFPTSESVSVSDIRFLNRVQSYPVAGIDVNGTTLIGGTDYITVGGTNTIEFPPKQNLIYHADGMTTQFDISSATNGIGNVYINGSLKTINIDYTVVGNTLSFTQPPIVMANNYSTMNAKMYISTGSTAYYTGHAGNSLSADNGFLFINGIMQLPSTYTTDTFSNIIPNAVPVIGDIVALYMAGNTISNTNTIFASDNFAGNGTRTSYTINKSANIDTTWVFLNGMYQTLGVDYTISTIGTVVFNTPPAIATAIHIRTIIPNPYAAFDRKHVVLNASGTATDVITGVITADPATMLVFVNGILQDGNTNNRDYTISNGNPDIINWINVPVAGAKITVRLINRIAISTYNQISVTPNNGDTITINQNNNLAIGDNVNIYYTQFPVGNLSSMQIISVPTAYDVVNNVLTMANTVLSDIVTVNYTLSRRGPNTSSILVRMVNIVDRIETNHLLYSGATGYEINRFIGLRVLNSTTAIIYEWNGTVWNVVPTTLVATDQVLVLQNQIIVEYNGTVFNTVFKTGNAYTMPPVLTYPPFGSGILSGTYALGQLPNANVDFPAAFQVNQFAGVY